MARIQGNISEIVTTPASVPVEFRSLSKGVLLAQTLVRPGTKVIRADDTGFFDVYLAMGDYEMVVGDAKVTLSVPDNNNTYNFVQLVVSGAIYAPTAPVGGAQPNASSIVSGLIRTNSNPAGGIGYVYLREEIDALINAVGGIFSRADIAAMKAVPASVVNRLCFLNAPLDGEGARYFWDNASADAEDIPNIVTPNSTPATGRWKILP